MSIFILMSYYVWENRSTKWYNVRQTYFSNKTDTSHQSAENCFYETNICKSGNKAIPLFRCHTLRNIDRTYFQHYDVYQIIDYFGRKWGKLSTLAHCYITNICASGFRFVNIDELTIRWKAQKNARCNSR